jgi:hypothetical protein
MPAVKHRPIEGACAWTGAELRNRTDWIRPFTAPELAEIDAAVRTVQRRGLGVTCRDGWRDVTQFRALRKSAPVT